MYSLQYAMDIQIRSRTFALAAPYETADQVQGAVDCLMVKPKMTYPRNPLKSLTPNSAHAWTRP